MDKDGFSEREKAILIRFFLAAKKLGRSKSDETGKRYAAEMANAVSDLLGEINRSRGL